MLSQRQRWRSQPQPRLLLRLASCACLRGPYRADASLSTQPLPQRVRCASRRLLSWRPRLREPRPSPTEPARRSRLRALGPTGSTIRARVKIQNILKRVQLVSRRHRSSLGFASRRGRGPHGPCVAKVVRTQPRWQRRGPSKHTVESDSWISLSNGLNGIIRSDQLNGCQLE